LIRNKEDVLHRLYNFEKTVSLSNSHHAISGSSYEEITREYREIIQKAKDRVMGDMENYVKEVFNEEYDELV
jgi:hypothetical protein